ncbi:MAG: alpha/beta fold hydrolase [Phycisphaerales bacterium]|nr:alpha/beta fold hydrolase [Phycisphaerales bacterium]
MRVRAGDGIELSVVEHGQGMPVLFIHGFPLCGEFWQPTVRWLQGYRAILPDLRGHGASAVSEQASIEQYADDLIAVLQGCVGREPVVVCGLSLGGIIALELATRHRERLRGLVLVDCRYLEETQEGRQQRETLADRVLNEGVEELAGEMAGRLFAPGASEKLRTEWRARMAATHPRGVAAAVRAIAARRDYAGLLATLAVPTLVVFGAEDIVTPPVIGHEMARAIPGATFVEIEAAGHLPPIEQPERFAGVLQEWLDALPGR